MRNPIDDIEWKAKSPGNGKADLLQVGVDLLRVEQMGRVPVITFL